MIAKRNRLGSSYYAPFILWDAVAAGTTSSDLRASNEGHLCWGESLGDMLGSMSEFLMLATSRSPAQWMTLAIARESADEASVAPGAPEHRPVRRIRDGARTNVKHDVRRG